MLDQTETHVLVHGVAYTPAEARTLANDILGLASKVEWAARDRAAAQASAAAEVAFRAAREAEGATHVERYSGGAWRWRAKDGTPMVCDGWGTTGAAHSAWHVGAGPELEGRCYNGRKWRTLDEIAKVGDPFIVAWRVKEVRDGE